MRWCFCKVCKKWLVLRSANTLEKFSQTVYDVLDWYVEEVFSDYEAATSWWELTWISCDYNRVICLDVTELCPGQNRHYGVIEEHFWTSLKCLLPTMLRHCIRQYYASFPHGRRERHGLKSCRIEQQPGHQTFLRVWIEWQDKINQESWPCDRTESWADIDGRFIAMIINNDVRSIWYCRSIYVYSPSWLLISNLYVAWTYVTL